MIPADLSPLWNHLWQSTLCAAAVWLLALAVRKNHAAVRYRLWFAASVKFLVPFSLLVSAASQFHWRTTPVNAPPAIAVAVEQVSRPFALPVSTPALAQSNPIPAILLVLWLTGVAIGIGYWLRWWRSIEAVRGAARPLSLNLPILVMSAPGRLEPGVFGIFKPVLLLPDGIAARLNTEQLEAVIAHELCHVRRRDNLTAAIHMVAETVFWFHPLVWWIRTRLVEERERACDEEVLRHADPHVYAEGILNVCRFYLESPLVCASGVTGADLRKRMETIMAFQIARNLDWRRKLLLALAGTAAVAMPVAAGMWNAPARAQARNAAAKRPEFDVVSIKPTSMIGGAIPIGRSATPGSVTLLGITPKDVIVRAYSIKGYQISGPGWIDQERYDIMARVGRSTSDAEQRLMLQSMLSDRFQLAAHIETRVLPAYELAVGKNGPKLHQATPDEIGGRVFPNAPGVSARQISMARLAELLSTKLDRPVADKTGLSGLFDIDLKWTPDTAPPDSGLGPSVFTAVQEQLGLRLEARRLPIDVLVIDRATKPAPN